MNSILNPNLPLGEGVFDPEETVTSDDSVETVDEEIVKLDKEAVAAAEAGEIEKAIQLFDKVFDPKHSSNEKQVLKYMSAGKGKINRDLSRKRGNAQFLPADTPAGQGLLAMCVCVGGE